MSFVNQRGCDSAAHNTRSNKDCTCDAGVIGRVAIRCHYLIYIGGVSIEETDINGKHDKNCNIERRPHQTLNRCTQRQFWNESRWTWGG